MAGDGSLVSSERTLIGRRGGILRIGEGCVASAMKPVAWMIAACGASWLVVFAILGRMPAPELAVGMAGPLTVAGTTWLLIERAFRINPIRVSGLVMTAFFAK